MTLGPLDFDAFFQALWDRDPYSWQRRLARQIYDQGTWPEQLDLPTGAGKTSALDVAVFLLACDADRPPAQRRFPRRVFLVVDRRTIVDQAAARAHLLAERIAEARGGVLAEVARRLCLYHGGDRPLTTTVLRGAMVRDDAWARRPDQPLIALSTVDQVGSRLLFRGYGVSDGMRPVHAGLLGRDCLYLLDEVHLAAPFEQTLSMLQGRYIRDGGALEQPARLLVSRLSATQRDQREGSPFQLGPEDHAHPALRRRLEARKPTSLLEVPVKGEEPERVAAFAARVASEAQALGGAGCTTGVIVNRVETARQVARLLGEAGRSVALITGRMRPLDRAQVEREIAGWVDPEREVGGEGAPRFLVATQCVEAGADYDLDALVSECAPLDALRQRLGRLNRSGLRGGARALVVIRADQAKPDAVDPVYGAAMATTWAWLQTQTALDFGISALQVPSGDDLRPLLAASAQAPLLLPAYVDQLAQTNPAPDPSPDVSLFLHGPRRPETEVQIVWRADLAPALFEAGDRDALCARLEAAPPGSLEALPLSLGALRRWLDPRDRRPVSLSDAGPELADDQDSNRRYSDDTPRILRWRGEESALITLAEVRPGDTLVFPAERGGLFLGTFDPADRSPVSDLGDEVQHKLRGRVTVRLHPGVLGADWAPELAAQDGEDGVDEQLLDRARAWLRAAPASLRDRLHLDALGSDWRALLHEDAGGRTLTLVGRHTTRGAEDASSDPETSSHTGARRPVTLRGHLAGVGFWAGRFARNLGLPAGLVQDLESAGRWHDLGKLDPRFQRWLHDGNPVAAARASEPIAKSTLPANDARARRRARERSGYPQGARHELMSLALLEAAPQVRAEVEGRGGDWALVCHLVASHHGYCRPFAPVAFDPQPLTLSWQGARASTAHGLERLDSGIADRFFALNARYSAHGLAWLEALLRLADHHRSALEQRGADEEGS